MPQAALTLRVNDEKVSVPGAALTLLAKGAPRRCIEEASVPQAALTLRARDEKVSVPQAALTLRVNDAVG